MAQTEIWSRRGAAGPQTGGTRRAREVPGARACLQKDRHRGFFLVRSLSACQLPRLPTYCCTAASSQRKGRCTSLTTITGSIWFIARPVGLSTYVLWNMRQPGWLHTAPRTGAARRHGLALTGVIVAFGLGGAALLAVRNLLPNAGSRLAAATLLVAGVCQVPEIWLNSTNARPIWASWALLFLFASLISAGACVSSSIAVLLGLAGLSGLYAAALAPCSSSAPSAQRTISGGQCSPSIISSSRAAAVSCGANFGEPGTRLWDG